MDNESNTFLCPDCCKDKYLEKFIVENAELDEPCTICLEQNSKTIRVHKNQELIDFFRLLVRYHYPEYEYNTHWGGVSVTSLLFQNNPILSNEFKNEEDRISEIEHLIYFLAGEWDYEGSVPLYKGHHPEYGRMLYPISIKAEKSKLWDKYKNRLKTHNYFLFEDEACAEISKLVEETVSKINKGQEYYRSRIGYTEEEKEFEFNKVLFKKPYSDSDISAPPPIKSDMGRANRKGVSYLYLSSSSKTSIGEIRPHPGHYISVGKFKSKKTLSVIDLSFIDLYHYFKNSDLETFKFLRDLSKELSLPVLPDEKEKYLVTQFISDIIRQLGYDGILFSSSVASGNNLVVFNENNFGYCQGSSELFKIQTIDFQYKEVDYHVDNFMQQVVEK